ncbi:DUF1810 domain-containing protein [Methylovulum psychrotolerans]|uniref:DUF1810 domain-containing protein n=1 Tax=Methylovulum psychrotolerans TaxID=1704499 RepID=A0A2S5CL17_9GAMM|nr:DUF1810 domain-containing protein [Methylovulum psychrotolerans]POZ51509.1 hypothetical protein AADEFJLK_02375 [Methylovulum psychrotolerans]
MRSDGFDLERFVSAQADSYQRVLAELTGGKKQSHWMWYIFPQIAGLGRSDMAQRYAIQSLAEAVAYRQHPILGPRLLTCCGLVVAVEGKTALEILGSGIDVQKFQSSMTLFALTADGESVFSAALDNYFAGEADTQTLVLLRK